MASARPPAGLRSWSGRWRVERTAEVLARWGTVCHLCKQDGADSADHLIPRSVSGDDSLHNLRPAHQACNSARGTTPLPEWFATHPAPHHPVLPPSRQW